MHYKIIIIIFIIISTFNLSGQLLNPAQTQETKLDILEKLIADGSAAPSISGKIYNHKSKTTFASVNDFDKVLKSHKINFNSKTTIIIF
jgi:hypothetical protein